MFPALVFVLLAKLACVVGRQDLPTLDDGPSYTIFLLSLVRRQNTLGRVHESREVWTVSSPSRNNVLFVTWRVPRSLHAGWLSRYFAERYPRLTALP